MGANSKARREAKRKRAGARQRQRAALAAEAFDLDLPGALEVWYALGAGEYDDDPQAAELMALMLSVRLMQDGLIDDLDDATRAQLAAMPAARWTLGGLQSVANSLPAEERTNLVEDLAERARILIRDGYLTRAGDGAVYVTMPDEAATG